MTDPLILEAIRKLTEAAELLRLAVTDDAAQAGVDLPFLNQRLDQLSFGPGYGVRLQHMFEHHRDIDGVGIPLVTVRDLVALSESEIMWQPNIGKQCLLRLKAVLAPHGLHFGMTDFKLRSVA